MVEISYEPATEEHCIELAPRLKRADRREVFRAEGKRPLQALLEGRDASEQCFAVKLDGELVAMFGIVPMNVVAGIATPWFLSAPLRYTAAKRLLRHARWWVRKFLYRYPVLIQTIDQEHTESLRFVSFLGFQIVGSGTKGWKRGKYHVIKLTKVHKRRSAECVRQSQA